MAADPTPEAEHPDGAAPAPEGGRGRGRVILAAALLAAAGLGATVAYSQFGAVDRIVNAQQDDPEDVPPVEYGEFMQLEPLVVNPAETGGARFLMVSVALESAEAAVLEEVALKDVVVRDAINYALSQKTVGTLGDVGSREAIKEEIRTLVNGLLSEGTVDRLYFTQFMLQ
ncbi:MAG: flagellar basal body-associated FliL family protein [Bacteroidota bacterium]